MPHFYLGAYLWARYGFEADAIVHYGTHGSLEFTYGKSVCLSRDCWPDILIGDVPHIYPYVINNVGEAMVAKRRSNAVIVSHMTPPFTESSLYGELSTLHEKIHDWEAAEDEELGEATRETITELVRSLELAADLEIEPTQLESRFLNDDELDTLHNYIHELKDQSITDGLHVIGRSFSEEQVRDTVVQMLGAEANETTLAVIGLADDPDVREIQGELMSELVDRVLDGELTEESSFSADVLAELRDGELKEVGAEREEALARITGSAKELEPSTFWREEGVSRVQQQGHRLQQRKFLGVLDDIRSFADAPAPIAECRTRPVHSGTTGRVHPSIVRR